MLYGAGAGICAGVWVIIFAQAESVVDKSRLKNAADAAWSDGLFFLCLLWPFGLPFGLTILLASFLMPRPQASVEIEIIDDEEEEEEDEEEEDGVPDERLANNKTAIRPAGKNEKSANG